MAVDDTTKDAYIALMTVHVFTAIVWLGGGLMITMQAEKARAAKNDQELVKVAMSAEFWSTHYFIPAAVVLLGCGFGMIGVGHLGYSKPFIDIGLVGWFVSFVIGSAYLGPQSGKAKVSMEKSNGEISKEVVDRVHRILFVARIDLVILVGVMACMVIQPGGSV